MFDLRCRSYQYLLDFLRSLLKTLNLLSSIFSSRFQMKIGQMFSFLLRRIAARDNKSNTHAVRTQYNSRIID